MNAISYKTATFAFLKSTILSYMVLGGSAFASVNSQPLATNNDSLIFFKKLTFSKIKRKAVSWFNEGLTDFIESSKHSHESFHASYVHDQSYFKDDHLKTNSTWGAHYDSDVLPARIIDRKPINTALHTASYPLAQDGLVQFKIKFENLNSNLKGRKSFETVLKAKQSYGVYPNLRYAINDRVTLNAVLELEGNCQKIMISDHQPVYVERNELLKQNIKAAVDTGVAYSVNSYLAVEGDLKYQFVWKEPQNTTNYEGLNFKAHNSFAQTQGKLVFSIGNGLLCYASASAGYYLRKTLQIKSREIIKSREKKFFKDSIDFHLEGGIKIKPSDNLNLLLHLAQNIKPGKKLSQSAMIKLSITL